MRTFDWELLPHFLAVARAGSLRNAAEMVGASYGTVNRSIQALESSYGVRLFHRSQRGFSLTEFGEALLPMAEEAEQKIFAARKRVEGLDRSEAGKIRFSLTPTLAYDIVAPIVARFSDQFPEIDIEMRLTSEVESITNDKTDISLRAAHEVTEDVVARKLFQLEIGVYASKDYLKQKVPIAGQGGTGLTWIGTPTKGAPESWTQRSPFPSATLRHEVSDGQMRMRLVNLSVGMSHMSTLFEPVFPNLRRVPGTELSPGPWLWLLLHSDLRRTVRVRRFVDFLTEEMRALHKTGKHGPFS
ncbi:LysR family transcriptional regulator [Parasedimentitalea marina]|uniref:LysR family transcriptional regulator n=1 Tax=Parasedimentitalea marina TaxID=2483033 RepID=A0A3T0N3V8_9RHOB|nr:LysR family transcriptional regulator [Parasedimentitalea marina]AZV78720.1 LysR family transcriptional regulator [Parasedimentitalea marina]